MGMEASQKGFVATPDFINVEIPVKKIKKGKKGLSPHAGQFTLIKPREETEQIIKEVFNKTDKIEETKSVKLLTAPKPDSKPIKKVALLSWNSLYGISQGIDGIYVSQLASALFEEGQEVHIFTRKKDDQAANEKIDGVYYHRIQIDSTLPLLEQISRFGAWISERIKKIEAQAGHFDVIHCNDWQPVKAIRNLQNGIQRQVVVSLHPNNKINELKNAGDRGNHLDLLANELIEKSNLLICDNQRFEQDVLNHFSLPQSKMSFIPGPFNWEDFQLAVDRGEIKRKYAIGPVDPLVLFVGSFSPSYAPDILIDAIPALLKNTPQVRFLLVGDGELMWPIRVKAHYLLFEHALRLAGHKEGHDLCELFHAADVVVIPNRVETGTYQLLAAWSAQKPVVATGAGGCGLLKHEENGVQVYDNPGSIVWGIEKIFYDWEKGHRMAQKGWEYIQEHYSWRSVARKTKEVYQWKAHQLTGSNY